MDAQGASEGDLAVSLVQPPLRPETVSEPSLGDPNNDSGGGIEGLWIA